jgi:DNA polymerase
MLKKCHLCTARKDAYQPVSWLMPTKPSKISIMVIGRNPGKEEDEQGLPFVGKSGKFLNEYLKECGIEREQCWITNTIKCHTSKNRAPDIIEIRTCADKYLAKEIAIFEPKLIFILGSDAYRGVFCHKLTPWVENTGKVITKGDVKYVILPHPSAVISYDKSLKERYDMTVDRVKAIIR